jgi:membrane protein implicated in regulation of membrane protease activity
MVGQRGTAIAAIPAGGMGRISAFGEIWNARSAEAVAAGESIVVVAIDGLTATVRRTSSSEEA